MRKQTVLPLGLFFCIVCLHIDASEFQIAIDDNLPTQTGFLAFDLIAGSPAPGDTVTISDFTTDGAFGSSSQSGSVGGTLAPGPLTLADTSFFNEWLQSVTYGTTISFQLVIGGNVPSGIPDSFSFYLLDSDRNPFPTSDPTGADSLFAIDLNGLSTTPTAFSSDIAAITIQTVTSAVPEPWSLPITGVGLLWLFVRHMRNRQRVSAHRLHPEI